MHASGSNSSGSYTVQGGSSNDDIPPQSHPGVADTLLGKRHRDSTASNVTGTFEEGREAEFTDDELAKRVVRPMKKRAKLSQDPEGQGSSLGLQSEEVQEMDVLDEDESEAPPAPRVPSFTVYTGGNDSDYMDPPPPTTHLPEYFAPSSPTGPPRHPTTTTINTSTAHASENQNPFSFSFLPISSTPGGPMLPSFPYPEPPQSPSPAGHHPTGPFGSAVSGRTDIFQSFGLPAPGRPGSTRAPTASGSGLMSSTTTTAAAISRHDGGGFVNPAALSQDSGTSDRGRVTSHDVATGLGLTAVKTPEPAGSNSQADSQQPMKRTMYGTELDVDTRFGDFGVEGVATGFWAGGRF